MVDDVVDVEYDGVVDVAAQMLLLANDEPLGVGVVDQEFDCAGVMVFVDQGFDPGVVAVAMWDDEDDNDDD